MSEQFDRDADIRALCCSITRWFHDFHDTCPDTLSDFAHEAMVLEDYIQDGGTIALNCLEGSIKFVR